MRGTSKAALKMLAAIFLLLLLTYPVFFIIYRLAIFQTVPRDDYAPYLLWLTGSPGGALPGSPYVYRVLSIILAWPFYYLLPVFHLTNIPAAVTVPYERATAALSMLSDLAAIAAAVITYGLAKRLGKPAASAILAALLVYAGCWFTQIEGIDTLTVLGVAMMVFLLPLADWYFLALLPLAFVNEKIPLIIFMYLAIRCVTTATEWQLWWRKLAVAVLALGLYATALIWVHAPGNEYQLHPSGYIGNFLTNIQINLSARAVLLNWAPTVILLALALLSRGHTSPFGKYDAWLIPALAAMALVLTQDFQIGRIVMMAMPVFAIPAAEKLAPYLVYTLEDASP